MATRLYVLAIPRAGQRQPDGETSNQLSAQGLLGGDIGAVEAISTDPGTQRRRGFYRGRYAWKMAAELEELAAYQGPLPVFGTRDPDAEAYYAVESASANAVEAPAADWLQRYDIRLTREGTRATHRRELTTNQRELSHPFGTATDAPVGVPATASAVRWLNPSTDETTAASPTTQTAELGDVNQYNLAQAPYSEASLVYDIPYTDEGPVDVRVWDTRGLASKLDADDVLQFQKVFSAAHSFPADGEAIIDNGLIRLRVDPTSDPGVAVETWDTGTSSWTTQALGTGSGAGDWTLVELDIAERPDQRLGAARVDAWSRWRNTATGDEYRLDLTVHRGWDSVQIARVPDATAGVPTGLQSLLAPIASDRLLHPQPVRQLRPREAIQ